MLQFYLLNISISRDFHGKCINANISKNANILIASAFLNNKLKKNKVFEVITFRIRRPRHNYDAIS